MNVLKTKSVVAVCIVAMLLAVSVGSVVACVPKNNHKQSNIGFIVVSGGSGYTTPHVVVSGGGGHGLTAVAHVSQGVVISVTVVTPGFGYASSPTITLKDPSPRANGAVVLACFIVKIPTPTFTR